MVLRTGLSLFLGACVIGAPVLLSAEEPKKEEPKKDAPKKEEKKGPDKNTDLALDPEKAVGDFKTQGEYSGAVTSADGKKSNLAAQIVALGGGTFRAVILPGGLPGDGWDEKTKIEIDGKTEGDKTAFAAKDGKGYTATIAGETITGKTDTGDAFELKKVMRESPTLGAKPPEGAVVLFDGTNVDAWEKGVMDERKLLDTSHGDTKTKKEFKDFTLHLEYREPFKPYGRGQDRGNSGCYLQGMYEVQVLDSFGLKGENNEAGGIYTKAKPRINMAFPPLSWQTYDIEFEAAKYDEAGKKTKGPVVTVKHNNVVIHDKFEIPGTTGGAIKKEEAPGTGPIKLQGHGNPVFYRNIWIVEKK